RFPPSFFQACTAPNASFCTGTGVRLFPLRRKGKDPSPAPRTYFFPLYFYKAGRQYAAHHASGGPLYSHPHHIRSHAVAHMAYRAVPVSASLCSSILFFHNGHMNSDCSFWHNSAPVKHHRVRIPVRKRAVSLVIPRLKVL